MTAALPSLIDASTHPLPAPMLPTPQPLAAAKDRERRHRTTLKWLLRLGIVALLSAGIIAAFIFYRRANRAAGPHYETVQVDRGRIVARVTASGTVSPLVTVQVGSQVSGRVEELKVDFNSQVSKGQVIARIEPKLFQAALEQALANHAAARGNLTKSQDQAVDAKRQYLRSQGLAAKHFIAQADLDTAQTTWRAAVAQVAANQGRWSKARRLSIRRRSTSTTRRSYRPLVASSSRAT